MVAETALPPITVHGLDPVFQFLVRARNLPLLVAEKYIREALELDRLQIEFHVPGGTPNLAGSSVAPANGITGLAVC
jgi:hypothetical protein